MIGVVLVLFALATGTGSGPATQAQQAAPGPLSKAHSFLEGAANCAKCHEQGKKIVADRCLACHPKVASRIAAKRGVHREVTGDCEACHVEHQGLDVDIRPLDPLNFDHRAETGFPLEGKHAALAKSCPACHKTRSYMNNVRSCGACHTDYHRGGMTESCESCHTPQGWNIASRAFHKSGLFPLQGRHLTVPCASCHLDGVIKGTPTRCYDCHWIRRQDDPYRTRLGNECEECHRPTSWTAVSWNHGARTGLPLNSAHRTLDCDACHQNRLFTQANFACYSCHRENYEKATEPNHVRAGFPTQCEQCHLPSQTSWNQASVNHGTFFPLQGVHATIACAACHKNSVYAGTPHDCYGCHRADYERVQNPNHGAAGFPTSCDTCHRPTDTAFDQARFDHAGIFPLAGVHTTLACAACHKNNVYAGTSRDCYACHRADYERTQNPNHLAAGFPITCDACHRFADTSFDQARFDHGSIFPLQGVHATQACAACHKNNVYAGTPRDCYGCHRADYERTQNPNHLAAGFPTSCDSCHRPTDTSFSQGRFDHTAFPIASGRHAGHACSDCHPDRANFQVFSCFACHDRSGTDSNHRGVSGYSYNSQACYSCHPQGRT